MSGASAKHMSETSPPGPLDRMEIEEPGVAETRHHSVQLVRLLWERRQLLMRASAIGFVVSALLAFSIPNSYTAVAQLMPPDSQSSSALAMMTALAGKAGAGLAGLTGDLLGLKSSGALFIGVLRSETSQDQIVKQLDLKKVYGTRLSTDARRILDANTAISEDRKSGIITIKATDRNPQRSAAIANAYVDELNSLIAQLSTSAAHRERVFLEDRLKLAKTDLDEASNQLAQFSSKNNTLDVQVEGKAMLDAASTLSAQLIATEAQLQGLREIYTDNNPRVRALSGRVSELRRQLAKFGGADESSQSGDAPHQTLPSPQGLAESVGSSPFPSIRKLPLLGAKYSDYYRNAKIRETVFELLTEQYELAKVQEAKETPTVKVLDPAKVPERKSFPPHMLIVFLGTLLALAGSVVWLCSERSWAELEPSDPRKLLALEVAGTLKAKIPWASRNGDAPKSWPRQLWNRLSRKVSQSDTDV